MFLCNVMVGFTMLAMYIGCDKLHDVLCAGTFLPSVSGCDTGVVPRSSLVCLMSFIFMHVYVIMLYVYDHVMLYSVYSGLRSDVEGKALVSTDLGPMQRTRP